MKYRTLQNYTKVEVERVNSNKLEVSDEARTSAPQLFLVSPP